MSVKFNTSRSEAKIGKIKLRAIFFSFYLSIAQIGIGKTKSNFTPEKKNCWKLNLVCRADFISS